MKKILEEVDANKMVVVSVNVDVLMKVIENICKDIDEMKKKSERVDVLMNEMKKGESVTEVKRKVDEIEETFSKKIMFLEARGGRCKKQSENEEEANEENISDEVLKRLIELESKFSKFISDVSATSKLERISDIAMKVNDMSIDMRTLSNRVDDLAMSNANEIVDALMKKINSGEVDASQAMMLLAETKNKKKFGIIDEKMKKYDKDIASLSGRVTAMSDKLDDKLHTIQLNENSLTATINELSRTTNQKFNEVTNFVNKMKTTSIANQSVSTINQSDILSPRFESKEFSEINLNISELTKKIDFFEKKINENNFLKIDEIKNKISEIENSLCGYAQKIDFTTLQNIVETISTKFSAIKETSSKIIAENSKNQNDMFSIMKKIDSLNSSILHVKNKNPFTSVTQSRPIDLSKYLKISDFNDAVKEFNKDIDCVRQEINDLMRRITDVHSTIESRASMADISSLEAFLVKKIDDQKNFSLHKYADRIDMNKAIKRLQMQIDYAIELSAKPKEKNDSWLLAKKAISSNVCASCESFLGELKDNNEYIAWKKPYNPQEMTMRIGDGFSRMLKMISVKSMKNSKTSKMYDSDGDIMTTRSNREVTSLKLKHLKGNKEENENNNNNSVDSDMAQNPKVLKIYKKFKK